jgi:hypothetical protein
MRLSFTTLALLAMYGDTDADQALCLWEHLSKRQSKHLHIRSDRQVIRLTTPPQE